MKAVRLSLVVMFGVALFGASALAADGAAGGERKGRHMQRRMKPGKKIFERLVKELDLSADQQAQVKQILETHRQAMKNWQKENGDDLKALREQMKKARKAKDAETLKSLREKSAKVFKGRRELLKAMRQQIKEVLTKEQKVKAEKMFQQRRRAGTGNGMPRRALGQLDLTDEQKEKIRKIRENYRDRMKNAKPGDRRELMKKMHDEMGKILTDEQKAKAKNLHERMSRRGEEWAGLNLTDEQKARIKALRENYRKRMDSILTDEQRAKAAARREERGKRWRERRGRRGRGGRGHRRGPAADKD